MLPRCLLLYFPHHLPCRVTPRVPSFNSFCRDHPQCICGPKILRRSPPPPPQHSLRMPIVAHKITNQGVPMTTVSTKAANAANNCLISQHGCSKSLCRALKPHKQRDKIPDKLTSYIISLSSTMNLEAVLSHPLPLLQFLLRRFLSAKLQKTS